jgi:hypothetical protein
VFVPNVQGRMLKFLRRSIIGQDQALQVISAEICNHVEPGPLPPPFKPLIFSLHGPSQVGKSESHRRIAQALYNSKPDETTNINCMAGYNCPGYLVSNSQRYSRLWSRLNMAQQSLNSSSLQTLAPPCGWM